MIASYVSANQFSVSGDHSAEFIAGRRIKIDCGVDGLLYSTVQSSYYSDPTTTVTIKDPILTNNLSSILYGVVNSGAYGSLPDHEHSWSPGQGGILSGMTYDYKTSDFIAEHGHRYQCDTSAGSFVATTPENPTAMDEFMIADAAGSFANNNLLVSGIQNIRGISGTLTLDVNWAVVNMVYINESIGWRY